MIPECSNVVTHIFLLERILKLFNLKVIFTTPFQLKRSPVQYGIRTLGDGVFSRRIPFCVIGHLMRPYSSGHGSIARFPDCLARVFLRVSSIEKMGWYFFFIMILVVSISGLRDRRIDRCEQKITLLLDRIGVDSTEIDANIDAEIEGAKRSSMAKMNARLWPLIGWVSVGGVLGYPLGLLISPMFGLYSAGFIGIILWVPVGMAVGLIVGLFRVR